MYGVQHFRCQKDRINLFWNDQYKETDLDIISDDPWILKIKKYKDRRKNIEKKKDRCFYTNSGKIR